MDLLEGDIIAGPKYDGCGFNLKAIFQGRIWTFMINKANILQTMDVMTMVFHETHIVSHIWYFSLPDDLLP